MAPANLIPINPVMVDIAGVASFLGSSFLSFSLAFGEESIEFRQWEDIKIFTKSWQDTVWEIMTNLQTENSPNYKNK
jgi:hypothetical protein